MTITFTSEDKGMLTRQGRSYHSKAIFMLKGNTQSFVINHNVTSPMSPWPSDDNLSKCQAMTDQLASNQGQYCTMNGEHKNPFDLLTMMTDKGYKFEKDSLNEWVNCRHLQVNKSDSGFIEIRGNLLQISSAFHYRFFDKKTLNKWLRLAKKVDPDCLTKNAA